jgi:LacI family transcriptional regulator
MARRPTIKDLAREAEVGVATVDRILNGRGGVREETARRVAEAAHRIGYHARGLIDQRLDHARPEVRLGFVLHKEKQEFYKNFKSEIEIAVAQRSDVRVRARILFSPSQSPDDFVSRMKEVAEDCDVIAATAVSHPSLTTAAQDLESQGVPVFALLNDFAQGVRRNYVGLNNLKVGRIAAWMISTQVHMPGKLAVFVGGNRWHGHELRETGFRSFLRENAPAFSVLDTLVNLETRQITYEATLDLLSRHPDLRGIYVAGGGMEGAIAALREVRPPGKVVLVVNELTADSRAALSDRFVSMAIATPLPQLCRDLVELMVRAKAEEGGAVTGQRFLEPQLYIPESI